MFSFWFDLFLRCLILDHLALDLRKGFACKYQVFETYLHPPPVFSIRHEKRRYKRPHFVFLHSARLNVWHYSHDILTWSSDGLLLICMVSLGGGPLLEWLQVHWLCGKSQDVFAKSWCDAAQGEKCGRNGPLCDYHMHRNCGVTCFLS